MHTEFNITMAIGIAIGFASMYLLGLSTGYYVGKKDGSKSKENDE